MQEHIRILKRVGKVLIAVGLIDIAVMIYCMVNNMSYASSFNIFAVIGGAFLLSGNLRASGVITWFAAFLLVAFAGTPFLLPLLQPLDFTILQLRLYPIRIALLVVLWVFAIAFLSWVLRELRNRYVMEARLQAGMKIRSLRMPLIFGFVFLAMLAVALRTSLDGETAHFATEKAAKQLGPSYKYFVNSLHVNYSSRGKSVTATVTAYNDHEIRVIPLRWQEK